VNDNDFRYERDENFKDKALFGELTWHVSESFAITGGFRYFDNDYFNDTFMGVGLYTTFAFDDQVQFSGSDSDTLFKLNAAWNFADDRLMYGTISEGYRRGGANAVPLSGVFAEDPSWQTYAPDTTTNYEIGIKGGSAGSFYNISLFYVDWENIQLNTATTNWGFYAAVNGGDAHTQGVEFEYDTYFADDWHLGFGYAYTDGELDDSFLSPDGGFVAGVAGTPLPGVSEHTINVLLENTYHFGSDWDWVNSVTAYYQSEMENSISQSVKFAEELDSFSLWNLNSTFLHGPWSFGLFVKNLFDEEGVVGVFKEEYMGTDPTQNYFGNGAKDLITRPRTIGVTLSYDF
jgi:outer membrane receptor protein involved in Fe transport